MMHKLEKAAEYADQLIETAQKRPEKLLDPGSSTTKWKSIHQKLLELYLEESRREPICKRLKCTSHLLDKLVKRDQFNTLVVNLYPGNEGYSLMLKGRTGSDSETIKLPYEESELLEYIDAEELPPLLVDLLDKAQANIFYCGCVIVEIRDYRRTTNNTFDTRYVLLKPTSHTLLCDINTMTNDGHRWTQEDVYSLESQLLLQTIEPLCLDPSPSVFYVASKINSQKQKFNTHPLKRAVKKFSQAAVNRKRKMAQCAAPKHLKLYDFINKKKDRLKPGPPVNLKVGKTCVDMWRQREVLLTPPDHIDVDKYSRVLEKSKLTLDNTPVIIEDYTFETERSHGKVNYSRLTISQRMSDEHYIGELYVDRDYVDGQTRGSTCRFPLTTKANVDKYIKQFREIFTEEGRRQVKITHQVPGQPPTVTYTQTLQSMTSTQVALGGPQVALGGPQALITQATNLAATLTGQLGLTSGGDGSKKHPPIRLSLSLNPAVSMTGTQLISPQGTPTQSPGQIGGQPTAQLTLNLQQQQRIRQMGIYTNLQRTPGNDSPATTPTSGSQLPTYSQATGPSQILSTTVNNSIAGVKVPTPTPTPPLVAPPTLGTRRSSHVTEVSGLSQGNSLSQGATGLVHSGSLSSTASAAVNNQGGEGQLGFTLAAPSPAPQSVGALLQGGVPTGTPPPNVNITNLTSLPPNINLQNLAGLQHMGIAGLQGLQNLQNLQVSLSSVTLPGGITVPVPLTTINSSPSLSTQAGILVSSLPGVIAATSSNQAGPSSDTTQSGSQMGSTMPTYVTMVTSMPPGGTTQSVTSTTSQAPASGLPTTVFTSQSGMLQLPIGVAGGLQFMTTGSLKGASNIRAGTPLLLSQIPGQPGQTMQLLNATNLQQRLPVGSSSQAAPQGATQAKLSSQPVLAPGLPPSQPITQLRPGQPQTLTTQQFMQLSQQQIAQLAMANKQHPQQLQQVQQLQLLGKPPSLGSQPPHSQIRKSKKRTTPTPPKT